MIEIYNDLYSIIKLFLDKYVWYNYIFKREYLFNEFYKQNLYDNNIKKIDNDVKCKCVSCYVNINMKIDNKIYIGNGYISCKHCYLSFIPPYIINKHTYYCNLNTLIQIYQIKYKYPKFLNQLFDKSILKIINIGNSFDMELSFFPIEIFPYTKILKNMYAWIRISKWKYSKTIDINIIYNVFNGKIIRYKKYMFSIYFDFTIIYNNINKYIEDKKQWIDKRNNCNLKKLKKEFYHLIGYDQLLYIQIPNTLSDDLRLVSEFNKLNKKYRDKYILIFDKFIHYLHYIDKLDIL